MKKILTVIIILFSMNAFSQDTYLQTGDETIEERATTLTDKYSAQLGLRAEQELLFRKKVEEFMLRAQSIKKQYEGREMLNKLVINQQNETAEMGDILTRIQLDKYKEIKSTMQPLKQIK